MSEKPLADRIDEACPCNHSSIRASCRYELETDFKGCTCTIGGDWKDPCIRGIHALAQEVREMQERDAQVGRNALARSHEDTMAFDRAEERLSIAEAALREAPGPLHRGPVGERVYRLWFDGKRAGALKREKP